MKKIVDDNEERSEPVKIEAIEPTLLKSCRAILLHEDRSVPLSLLGAKKVHGNANSLKKAAE
jgi:hypothetical protein